MSIAGPFQLIMAGKCNKKILGVELIPQQDNTKLFSLYGNIILDIWLEIKKAESPSRFMNIKEAIGREYVDTLYPFKTLPYICNETWLKTTTRIKYKYEKHDEIPTKENTTIHILWGFLLPKYFPGNHGGHNCVCCSMMEANKNQKSNSELLKLIETYGDEEFMKWTPDGKDDRPPCNWPGFIVEHIKYFENFNYGPLNPPNTYTQYIMPDTPLFETNEMIHFKSMKNRFPAIIPDPLIHIILGFIGDIKTFPTSIREIKSCFVDEFSTILPGPLANIVLEYVEDPSASIRPLKHYWADESYSLGQEVQPNTIGVIYRSQYASIKKIIWEYLNHSKPMLMTSARTETDSLGLELGEEFNEMRHITAVCIIPLDSNGEPILADGNRHIDDNIKITHDMGVKFYDNNGDISDTCYRIKYPNEKYLIRTVPFTGCPDLLFDYDTKYIPLSRQIQLAIQYTANDPRIKKWKFVIIGY